MKLFQMWRVLRKMTPTYSFLRNLLQDVLHQNEVVKQEEARDPENRGPSAEENEGCPQDDRE